MEKRKMKNNKKVFLLVISLVALIFQQGCSSDGSTEEVIVNPDLQDMWQGNSNERRFQESSSQGSTAVESALELSEKYSILSTETNMLRQNNKNLTNENQKLREQLVTIQKQLQQTQNELKEANEVMINMRSELNNWKKDVLGFRDEMRNADKAQLEALLKIMKVLGGDVNIEVVQSNSSNSTVASIK
jgi:chromosome segregation ATPase